MSELGISTIDEILEKGIRRAVQKEKVSDLSNLVKKNGVAKAISDIESEAHKIYREEEMEAVKKVLETRNIPKKEAEQVSIIFIEEDLVTRLANTRRVRGGLTSEKILRKVLESIEIPCEKGRVTVKGYRPDIVVPSNKALVQSPNKVAAIVVKRTLRERWAEDIGIFSSFKNGMFVLLLPDPDFNESKAKDMVQRGMKKVYINDALHERSREFVTAEFKKHSQLPVDLLKVIGVKQRKLA